MAGFALMRVRSKEEALYWCDRFAALIGDVELCLGPGGGGLGPGHDAEARRRAAALPLDAQAFNEIEVRQLPE